MRKPYYLPMPLPRPPTSPRVVTFSELLVRHQIIDRLKPKQGHFLEESLPMIEVHGSWLVLKIVVAFHVVSATWLDGFFINGAVSTFYLG